MGADAKDEDVSADVIIGQEMADLAGLVGDLVRRVAARPGAASEIADCLFDAAQRFGEIAQHDRDGRGHA